MNSKPESDLSVFHTVSNQAAIYRLVKSLTFVFGLAWLCFVSTQFVSQAEAGYWHTENLYGVELAREEGDGLNIGLKLARHYYGASGLAPRPKCYKEYKGVAICDGWSISIYCIIGKPGPTPCSRRAIHTCYDGTVETENFECVALGSVCTPQAPSEDVASGADVTVDPVELYSGRVVETTSDWTDMRGQLKLTRYYASKISSFGAPTQSRFGNNWRSGFDSRAFYFDQLNPPFYGSRIHIMLPNGNEAIFRWEFTKWQPIFNKGTPGYPGTPNWQPITDSNYSILATTPNVVLQTPSGTRYTYNFDGLLTQIERIGGYKQFLEYSGTLNTRVADNLGRSVTFQYFTDIAKKNYVSSATLPDGQKIVFNYAERLLPVPGFTNDDLDHESYVLTEVLYPDSTPANLLDNPKKVYEYLNDYHFPNAITKVTSETGGSCGRMDL
jgi:hypothetical protein